MMPLEPNGMPVSPSQKRPLAPAIIGDFADCRPGLNEGLSVSMAHLGCGDGFDTHEGFKPAACSRFKMAEIVAIRNHMSFAAMADQDYRLHGCKVKNLVGVSAKLAQGNPWIITRHR